MAKCQDVVAINWRALGAKLAVLSDVEQSEFLGGFANELSAYETRYSIETQMFAINSMLNDKERKVLKENFPSLWYQEGDD